MLKVDLTRLSSTDHKFAKRYLFWLSHEKHHDKYLQKQPELSKKTDKLKKINNPGLIQTENGNVQI